MLVNVGYRNFPTAFSPAALFAASEPGVWYDPSDVANTLWLYNLLTFTEQFDNAAWAKSAVGITANSTTAPNGTLTADTCTPDTTTAAHLLFQTTTVSGNNVQSMYVKANGYTKVSLREGQTGAYFASFDLSGSGSVLFTSSATATITAVGNGWFRIAVVGTLTGTTRLALYVLDPAYTTGSVTSSWTPNGTSGIFIWGAQVELGSTATTYQPITTVDAETIARFPLATLYQDSAGTTPVTAPNQPVGLMLSKDKGLVIGPELVTNGDFSSGDTGWTVPAGWTITGGGAVATATNASLRGGGVTTVSGITYRVDFDVISYTSGNLVITVGGNFSGNPSLTGAAMAPGRKSVFVISGSSPSRGVEFYGGSITATIDNISVKELPGNHATQSTSGSRPTYGIVPATGRRNLLTYSEQFDNAAWVKDYATVTANAASAPNGTTTADKLIATAVNSGHGVYQGIAIVTSSSYTLSAYFKSGEYAFASLAGYDNDTFFGMFDLTLGTVVNATGLSSSSITSVGNGWYRCTISRTATVTGTSYWYARPFPTSVYTGYTGDGTSGIYLWGAQLEASATATAYQQVVTAFEVTEANVASLSYIFFDGINRFMVTPTISPDIATSDGAARRNLLTFPSAFNDAAWAKGNATITANSSVAPDGTTTADTLVSAAATAATFVQQNITSTATTHTFSIYVKVSGANFVQLLWNGPSSSNHANFNISSGTITAGTYANATITSEGNDWYRISITSALASTSVTANAYLVDNGTAARGASYTGNGTSGILVWGAQLELGSTATAFQNIGTDKVQVFAGVRKLSDAAIGAVIETSINSNSNNGTLWLLAPGSPGTSMYSFRSKGTAAADTNVTGYAAPITNVVTGLGDISGDVSTVRVNGTQVGQSATDQGTGNYLAYPLYIGRRGGTTLPFNGQMYGLITRFGANLTTTAISRTESWLNNKTGAF